ncbi:DUF294 nucleotidyltransferase-like domain-containing protein [Corynebacterium lubricantis]|uniref:DUF294 nucleotidyltransferase-like domain-containing protein n=1 Tax=Corynebacterium lubricantis TaxID=541095 RepID=UPI000364172A|nr:DUF294 nucleotidyltransferase-like domain-containing protein [Corynebacterium lubricantis]
MSVELEEVRGFLAQQEPFAHLPDETLDALPRKMTMSYVRRGDTIISPGEENHALYIIRSGAVDVISTDDLLLDRREEGRNFGYSTLVGDPESHYRMVAVEDCLLLQLPRDDFNELIASHPETKVYFTSQSRRVKAAADEVRDSSAAELMRTPIAKLIQSRPPVTVTSDATLRQAAMIMTEANVSSIVIVDNGLEGILTDKDMRTRVVSQGLSSESIVSDVMTPNPRTVDTDILTFQAMLVMSEMGIHHLPVVDNGEVVGVLTSGDIFRQLQDDPIYLTADLARSSYEELKGAYRRAADVAARFIDRGATAEEAQRLMTSVADTVARRLIALIEEEIGPAPIPYAFVAVGSQGRREMGPASDQDNALVLDDSYDEKLHGEYFAKMSEFVCVGLDAAGQVLCPGNMMASNPEWRMTVTQWNKKFHHWVTALESESVLNAQIFFDFRALAGDEQMARGVHSNAVLAAKSSTRFHAHLAGLAAHREPPIGFFRGLVVERSGEYADTLDIKKGGIAAVVQMARLYAISAGSEEVETKERLKASAGNSVSQKGADDLIDAFDYLQILTVRHQAKQIRAGEKPNYRIDPKELPVGDRENLREAFGVIKGMQNALGNKYPVRNF